MASLHTVLMSLEEGDLLTETLKEKLKPALREYIKLLEATPNLSEEFSEALDSLNKLLHRCQNAKEEYQFENKEHRDKLFKHKQLQKMSKILKALIGYEERYRKDKKFADKAFGSKSEYKVFLLNNVEWVLTKTKYEFTED